MMKKPTRFYISLYIIIPVIFAGFSILGAIVAFQLTTFMIRQEGIGGGAADVVFYWIIAIAFVAFVCGMLLVRFLLQPSQRFVATAKRMPAVSIRRGEIRPGNKVSELAHMEYVFDTVADVLSKVDARQDFPEIIGDSREMRSVMSQIAKVAPTASTVLILGESGTGKELVANSLYDHSRRKGKPFIKLNCVAIPGELLESELFGHEKGAFTGATSRKIGKFEMADGGTLFLDEIGDMPLPLQAKILRVLQEKEFDRVGGARPVKVDVRIIAATNKNLEKMVADGHFREDLYYRLNVFNLHLPPLRERVEDIPQLAQFFLGRLDKPIEILPDAIAALQSYDWPGNVRELQNIIERAALLSEGKIAARHLPLGLAPRSRSAFTDTGMPFETGDLSIDDYMKTIEKKLIEDALKQTRGVQVEAAKLLNINPRSLWHRVKKHGIEVSAFKHEK